VVELLQLGDRGPPVLLGLLEAPPPPAVEDVTGAYPGEGRDAARYDWLGDSWPGWREVWLSWPGWVAPVWVEGKGEETWDGGKGEV